MRNVKKPLMLTACYLAMALSCCGMNNYHSANAKTVLTNIENKFENNVLSNDSEEPQLQHLDYQFEENVSYKLRIKISVVISVNIFGAEDNFGSCMLIFNQDDPNVSNIKVGDTVEIIGKYETREFLNIERRVFIVESSTYPGIDLIITPFSTYGQLDSNNLYHSFCFDHIFLDIDADNSIFYIGSKTVSFHLRDIYNIDDLDDADKIQQLIDYADDRREFCIEGVLYTTEDNLNFSISLRSIELSENAKNFNSGTYPFAKSEVPGNKYLSRLSFLYTETINEDKKTYSCNKANIEFKVEYNDSIYNYNNSTLGMLYAYKPSITKLNMTMDSIVNALDGDVDNLNDICSNVYKIERPAEVSEYYVEFSLAISDISSKNFDKEYTVLPYIIDADGNTYFGEESCYSVNSLARKYLDEKEIQDDQGLYDLLTWLSTYVG